MKYGGRWWVRVLYAGINEIAWQTYSHGRGGIAKYRYLFQQTPQTAKALRMDDPFEINQGHIERLAAGFICGQPGQLVVPYLQVAG